MALARRAHAAPRTPPQSRRLRCVRGSRETPGTPSRVAQAAPQLGASAGRPRHLSRRAAESTSPAERLGLLHLRSRLGLFLAPDSGASPASLARGPLRAKVCRANLATIQPTGSRHSSHKANPPGCKRGAALHARATDQVSGGAHASIVSSGRSASSMSAQSLARCTKLTFASRRAGLG